LAWDGDRSEEEVREALDQETAQLWIGEDQDVRCAVVTCLSRTRRGLICEIWLMGGRDRRRWLHCIDILEAAARERGCVSIELIGRKGWTRLLPAYRQAAVVLKKEFNDGWQEDKDEERTLGAGPTLHTQGDGADIEDVRRKPAAAAGHVQTGL